MTEKTRAAKRLDDLVRMAALIPRKVLARESELVTTKWPGYRFMSPLEATQEFRLQFIDATRDYFKRHIDLNLAPNVKGLDPLIFTERSPHLTQLWIARQHADEVGIRYESYLEFAFDFASRRQRKKPPRPNQLRPTQASGHAWWSKFESFLEGRVRLSAHRLSAVPQLLATNYRGLPAQRTARNTLIDELRMEPRSRDDLIDTWVTGQGLLSEEDIDRVIDRSEPPSEDVDFLVALASDADYWQTCFGVSASYGGSLACAACPQSRQCKRLADLMDERSLVTHGTVDPVLKDKRARGAARTARHRERKKLLGTVPEADVTLPDHSNI